ncbi:apolipoprotein D-like [Patiria miniata]|uniref:Lipocalin/cytosolic fatty-acid binding domain-containing protein n=1 Tax=Patiria miniata TaxID=46514 RepID=A0A914B1A9_PATMI|nr:apolipoprotein D-like [Patiria miniata]
MLCFIVLAAFVAGSNALGTVPELDPGMYIGRWYQMYSNGWTDLFSNLPNPQCVTADYGVINATYITVLNHNYNLEGEEGGISGYAYVPDVREPGKLKVSLEGVPVVGDYWVFKLGPIINGQYEYSLITDGEATRQLFVLARDPTDFNAKYDAEVQEYLTLVGFTTGPKKYEPVPQVPECKYLPLP